MHKKLVVGALTGGVTLFLWASVTHILLDWYGPHLRSFSNQELVQEAIVSSVPGAGLYLLPNLTPEQRTLPAAERRAAFAELQEQFDHGPMVLAVVRTGETAAFPVKLGKQFGLFVLVSLVATWLLLQTRLQGYGARALFVAAIAVPIVLSSKIPQWNWWDYPAGFILTETAEILIGWVLLGLVLAGVARPGVAPEPDPL